MKVDYETGAGSGIRALVSFETGEEQEANIKAA